MADYGIDNEQPVPTGYYIGEAPATATAPLDVSAPPYGTETSDPLFRKWRDQADQWVGGIA